MSMKDILLAALLVFNVYFAYAIYDLNKEKKEATVIVEVDPHLEKYSEIGYNDYATLYMFKQIFPTDTFNEMLLPEIEIALQDGTINENEWTGIQQKIKHLENTEKLDFYQLYLEGMQEKDLNTTVKAMVESFSTKANDFGNTFKKDLKELGNEASELGGTLKENLEGLVEESKDILSGKNSEGASVSSENTPLSSENTPLSSENTPPLNEESTTKELPKSTDSATKL